MSDSGQNPGFGFRNLDLDVRIQRTLKSGFGRPNPGFGSPNPGFGRQNPGFGRPNAGFGCPTSGFGRPHFSFYSDFQAF